MNTAETLDMLIHRAFSEGEAGEKTRLALMAVRDVFTTETQKNAARGAQKPKATLVASDCINARYGIPAQHCPCPECA